LGNERLEFFTWISSDDPTSADEAEIALLAQFTQQTSFSPSNMARREFFSDLYNAEHN